MIQAQPRPERWHIAWLLVWTAWGAAIGLLIIFVDGNVTGGLSWLSAGFFIGSCGIQVLTPLATPFQHWYQRFQTSDDHLGQLMRITMAGIDAGRDEESLRKAMERYQASDEYERFLEDVTFSTMLAVPPLFGLLHGTLLGGIVGALAPISPELGVSSGRGALLGILIGPLLLSFLAAATCFVMYRSPMRTSRSVRLTRRVKLLVSPVLIIPAILYCLECVSSKPRGSRRRLTHWTEASDGDCQNLP